MESFKSTTKIDEISIDSVTKFLENVPNESCGNDNWRNSTTSDSYCESISSESSTNTSRMDENFNVINYIAKEFEDLRIHRETIEGKVTSTVLRDEVSDENLPEFENLRVDSRAEENCKIQQLAGSIDSVVVSMGIALVKPAVANNLLDLDTPLFLGVEKLRSKKSVTSDCTLVGHIDDVFGPVGDPMYSVRLETGTYKLLRAQTMIYYMENHPSTTLIRVEEKTDNSFRLIRKKSRRVSE